MTNLPRKPSRINFEAIDSRQIERILSTGDLDSLTPDERDYFDLMEMVRGLRARMMFPGGKRIITKAGIIKLLKSDAYGLSDWMARQIYADALNFFYSEDNVRPRAWANLYAERYEKWADLAASMGKLKEAKSMLHEAAKLRGCYDEATPEIPQELLDASPVVIYTHDPESMGAPKADRRELEAFIDSLPEIPEISRRRVKEDAGIKKRDLYRRMIDDVKSSAMKANDIPEAAVKFGSDALVFCDWIDTTNFIVVGGRGVAKSTVIIARRSVKCVRLMPGAPIAIVADTYSNLVNNIMPAVQNGWKIDGLIEGIHYVKYKRPPLDWQRRCSVIVDDYKYVFSFWNGSVIFLGSLDNPSLLAGKSVAHLIFDEAKYASDARAARVMPILRGDAITYGRCHLYGGVTITTDMPDVTEGEHDWFFRYASEMDAGRIVRIVQAAGELNRLRLKLTRANSEATPDVKKIARLEKRIDYYTGGLLKLRKGQTFFMNISSFVNIDILTVDYAKRLYNGALELHEFLKSVMGMRPGVRKDARFYVLFSDTHKYSDGTVSGVAAHTSAELRYLDPSRPIDGGMDFGNMLSFVIGQPDGRRYRVHKNFYEIPPGWFRELADQFLDFFSSHTFKTLNLYYDRSGNNFQKQGEDYAGKIKEAIEKDAAGRRTGWTVVLKSRKQATIKQNDEYDFMHELMRGENQRLPLLLVDILNCPEMVCSIEGAKAEVKYRGQQKVVAKVKKTEKLEPKKLPKLSTNFSDAFKYLMMRREWLTAAKAATSTAPAAADLAERWMTDNFGD